MLQSRFLEQALIDYEPERRVTDGYTAQVVAELEDRISSLDQELQVIQLTPDPTVDRQLLQLWRQVTDGYTARVVAELEDRISSLDQELQVIQLTPDPTVDRQLLQLWRQRVGLMDALVNVHLTRASNVGL